MADTKISQLPPAPSLDPTDLVVVLYNAAANTSIDNGSISLRTMSIPNFTSNLVIANSTPQSSNSSGTQGSFSFDTGFLYICVSNNVWMRTPLSTW